MINVAGIYHNDLVNGPGLRTVLFLQGCPHHCKGCHNRHTWDVGVGKDFRLSELYKELTKNPMDKGITISGGEPLMQWEMLFPVVRKLKNNGYDLILYTGYKTTWINNKIKTDSKLLSFLSLFDMVITEPYIEAERVSPDDYRWYGSYNQKVCKIDNNQLVEIK